MNITQTLAPRRAGGYVFWDIDLEWLEFKYCQKRQAHIEVESLTSKDWECAETDNLSLSIPLLYSEFVKINHRHLVSLSMSTLK